jgi:O-antigen ligase
MEAAVDRCRALLRLGIYAVILLSPLPFGGVQPRTVLGLEIAAAGMAVVVAWILFLDPPALPVGVRSLWGPACGLALIAVVHLVLAAPTAEARSAVAAVLPETATTVAPPSLSPPDTLDAVLRGMTLAVFLVAASIAFDDRRSARSLGMVIVASATFQALYGATEYLSHHQHIFGYSKKHYLDSATGTFINRNHFAAYLAMGLPFALGPLIAGRVTLFGAGTWRQRFVRLSDSSNLLALLCGSAAVVIWIGVFLSYSRGGLAAALVATFVLATQGGIRRRWWILVAVSALAVAMLSWNEVRAPGERFAEDPETLITSNNRLPIWQAGLRMLPLYPVAGTGFGTFESAFQIYQPSSRLHWEHVHNDWLEAAIEGGLVTPVLVVWLLWLVARASRKARTSRTGRAPYRCAVAAVAAVLFHSALDFPLRIPAVAVLLACLLGVLCSDPQDADEVRSIARVG